MLNNMQNFESLLSERFGLSGFRRGQKEIISSILQGKDALAVLPTGGGKSLCYQYPAVFKNELVIVISPLIALMKDQVGSLQQRGIPAGCLYSGQSDLEKRLIFQQIETGGVFVLYLSPERVQKEGFQKWIQKRKIALFAIDEAHCVSQWGHDFREEYSQLGLLKKLRPDVPVLSLTASATPLVLRDIAKQLQLQSPDKHVHGFYRPNLYYQVEICPDEDAKFEMLLQALKKFTTGRVIIYCGTRNKSEEVAATLSQYFEGVGFYHAGIENKERHNIQDAYSRGDLRILVATNAFGMGIDHPDVRLVVHFQMPGNIDSLYQEMGRAGRDGRPSTCLMLYTRKDKGLQSFFIQQSKASEAIKSSRWNTLDALVAYAEGGECRHSEILTYYQDSQRISRCNHCDSCDPSSDRRILKPLLPLVSVGGKTKNKTSKSKEAYEILTGEQQVIFEDLKKWRKDKAKELDVPAFVILGDRSLRELAVKTPASIASLEGIYGLGDAKIDRFGKDILKVLSFQSPAF